jgi:hypothetical protein
MDIPVEELLTMKKPTMGENDELIYALAPEHIAGYFDNKTEEFIENPRYNPSYISYRDRDDF